MLSYTDMLSYTEVLYDDTKEIREDLSFLIVTATPIETWAVHNSLKPFPGYDKILQIYYKNQTYYIGVFGAYAIIHVQCEMGSISRDSSIITITKAIDCWKPKAVVMIGIAFGSNADEQNIGDVLVSEAVFPYDIQRVGKEKIHRGHTIRTGVKLLNRFRNTQGWKYDLSNKKEAKNIASRLVKNKLAACVNIVEKLESLFWWQGKLDSAQESLLIVKTKAPLLNEIVKLVTEIHSYDIPEIIALPIIGGNQDYLEWIGKEVK